MTQIYSELMHRLQTLPLKEPARYASIKLEIRRLQPQTPKLEPLTLEP
jgi:hypothetical protein